MRKRKWLVVVLVLVLLCVLAGTLVWFFLLRDKTTTDDGESTRIGGIEAEVDSYELFKSIDIDGIRDTVLDLSSMGSRLSGYPGAKLAEEYVLNRFQELGLEVRTQEFTLTTPVDLSASLTLLDEGKEIELYSFWPNGVRTTTTPPEGLEGHLVYIQRGEFRQMNGLDIEDAIVLMDFDESYWTNAVILGARAVIFIEPEQGLRGHFSDKFLDTPIDIPRFLVDRDSGLALAEKCQSLQYDVDISANLKSRMDWVKTVNKNIMAYLEGSDPELKNEIIIIQAYYDSMSAVPKLAPGAEQAISMGVLFELAESFIEYRPQRSIMFLATAGHGMGLTGSKAFANNQMRLDKFRKNDGSIDYQKLEKAFETRKREDALSLPDYPIQDYLNGQTFAKTIAFSLEITSRNDVIGLFYKGYYWDITGDTPDPQAAFSEFGRENFRYYAENLVTKLEEASKTEELGIDIVAAEDRRELMFPYEKYFVDAINRGLGRNWHTHMGAPVGFDGETFTMAGASGMGFITTNDARPFIDTPHDTIEKIDFENVDIQVRFLAGLLWDFLNDPEAADPAALTPTMHTIAGETVKVDPKDNFLPSVIEPGTLVTFRKPNGTRTLPGIRARLYDITEYSTWTTYEGEYGAVFNFLGATSDKSGSGESEILAFRLDAETGRILQATDLGREGEDKYTNVFDRFDDQFITLVMFTADSLELYDLMDQREFAIFSEIQVYDASRDSVPDEFSVVTGPDEAFFVVFAPKGVPLKLTMYLPLKGLRTLGGAVLNANDDIPYGIGFDSAAYDKIPLTAFKSTQDLWYLNDFRINIFESYGIENNRVRELHDMSKEKLGLAQQALDNKEYDKFIEYSRAAASNELRAYPEVLSTMNDSVRGVMFYLVMLVPFVFFLERLIFAFSDIRKQIPAVLIIFVVIFMILRYIHPAFEMALTPAILLLAFIILALTVLVTWIIGGKFEEEIAKLRPKRAGVEKVDVGRATASSVAFILGIENMRKRRVRTVLTCITLVILTFTVISFTSFRTYLRYNRVKLPGEDSFSDGILIRGRAWEDLSDYVRIVIDNKYGNDNLVVARSWYMTMSHAAALEGEKSYVDLNTETAKTTIDGAIGMMPEENLLNPIEDTLIAGRWLNHDDYTVAIIADNVAEALNITEEDIGKATFRISGFDVKVIGIFDSEKFSALKGLDGEELTPIDYSATMDLMMMVLGRGDQADIPTAGSGSDSTPVKYTHLRADNVIIMPYRFARDIGGSLRAVVVKPGESSNIQSMVEELITRISFHIYASINGERYVFSSTGMTAVQGATNVFIPLLIASLIVLNTMLGSVYERTREIEIYSSVGLAPSHIGALFMAESCVYAVLGAVSGYVIGQTIAKVVTAFDLLQGLNLNYSSMATVGSTGLVMVVVLLSTVYPARQASRLAAPAIERRWKLPEPDGDTLTAILPFTLSEGEAMGATIFLKDYIGGHDEQSVGTFQSRNIRMYSEPDDTGVPSYIFECIAHLAPYDLGVMQGVRVIIFKAKGKIGYEVRAEVTRMAGDIPSWKRSNLQFIGEIRKQFLIWRTISVPIKNEYEQRAKEALERG